MEGSCYRVRHLFGGVRQQGLGAAASSRRKPANRGNLLGVKASSRRKGANGGNLLGIRVVGGWKPPLLTAPLGVVGDS